MNNFEKATTQAAESIGGWFNDVYEGLRALSKDSEKAIRSARGRRVLMSEKDLRSVRPAARLFLGQHPIPEAAGVVISPEQTDTKRGSVEWWKRGSGDSMQKVVFNLAPDVAGFYDFVEFEWFSGVVKTGKPGFQGPYLDYAGMDEYIVTLMVPLSLDDFIIGTAGCDVEVRALETEIVPILRRIPADAALISNKNRIVAGNSGRFLVGNRVGDVPSDGVRVDIPGEILGLSLIAVPIIDSY